MDPRIEVHNTVPSNLSQLLTNKETPWQISDHLFQRIQEKAWEGEPNEMHYKKCQILPDDPENAFLLKYFEQQKPANLFITEAYCIHTPSLTQAFEAHVEKIDAKAKTFTPEWDQEDNKLERTEVIQRWKNQTEQFFPVTLKKSNRSDTLTNVRILPLWHGTSEKVCHSIATSGFTYFGKQHFFNPNAKPSQFKCTDPGYFGGGIYFTNSAKYASMYNSGNLLLAWVAMKEPFPVINDQPHPNQGKDMQKLRGHGAYQTYDAHYIPVASIRAEDPSCMEYYPCYQNQIPECDEIVVFQEAQTLPRFWVQLGINLPKPVAPNPEDPILIASSISSEPLDKQKSYILENRHKRGSQSIFFYLAKEMYAQGYIPHFFEAFCKSSDTITLKLSYQLETILQCLQVCHDPSIPIPAIGQFVKENSNPGQSLWDTLLDNGYPPFLSAVCHNQENTLKWLITHYPKLLEQTTEKHNAPWDERSHYTIVESKTIVLPYEGSLYTLSAHHDRIAILEWLHQKHPETLRAHAKEALFVAISEGKLPMIHYLLQIIPSLFDQVKENPTLLKFSAKTDEKTLDYLSKKVPNFTLSLLSYAVQRGLNKTVQFLFSKVDLKNREKILFLALQEQKKLIIQTILQIEPSLISIRDEQGGNLLHLAAAHGNEEILDLLYHKNPALLLQTTENGSTPLHYAAYFGQIEAGKWLFQNAPVLLNVTDQKNNTPLSIAESENQAAFAQWIEFVGGKTKCIVM